MNGFGKLPYLVTKLPLLKCVDSEKVRNVESEIFFSAFFKKDHDTS